MTLKQLAAKKKEILDKCERLNADANANIEDVRSATAELNKIIVDIELAEAIEAEVTKKAAKKIDNGEMSNYENEEVEEGRGSKAYAKAFETALRGRDLSTDDRMELQEVNNALSSDTDADGGYLIPTDQQTAIKELKREMQSLEDEVTVEPVSTNKGSRVIEEDAEHTPFQVVAEGDDAPDAGSPQFRQVNYVIEDRIGILPMPNSLLKDNTATLLNYVNRWLAKKSVATRNSLILAVLAALTPTAIVDNDDVKDVLNTQLDPAISIMSKVYTNQDGFNALDKMKDDNGNYLLQPHPTDETKRLLKGRVVKVYSNKIMKTTGTTTKLAPIFFGSLKEAVTLFDREAISLLSTNVGGDSFKKNRTDTRATSREDVVLMDGDAIVFGQIDVTPA